MAALAYRPSVDAAGSCSYLSDGMSPLVVHEHLIRAAAALVLVQASRSAPIACTACSTHWCWQCGGPYYGTEEQCHDGKTSRMEYHNDFFNCKNVNQKEIEAGDDSVRVRLNPSTGGGSQAVPFATLFFDKDRSGQVDYVELYTVLTKHRVEAQRAARVRDRCISHRRQLRCR